MCRHPGHYGSMHTRYVSKPTPVEVCTPNPVYPLNPHNTSWLLVELLEVRPAAGASGGEATNPTLYCYNLSYLTSSYFLLSNQPHLPFPCPQCSVPPSSYSSSTSSDICPSSFVDRSYPVLATGGPLLPQPPPCIMCCPHN